MGGRNWLDFSVEIGMDMIFVCVGFENDLFLVSGSKLCRGIETDLAVEWGSKLT